MKFIDIHCHIYVYGNEIENIVKRASEKGVSIIVNNGIDAKSNRETLKLSKKCPEIKAALGLYPINALSMNEKEIEEELEFIEKNKDKIVMIGEIGIDLKESDDLEKQKKIFEKFIKLAIRLNLPVAVHSRNAEKECIEVLEKFGTKKVIMHCFSGGMKLVKKIVERGWFLSVPSSVKYNEHFQKIVEIVPLGSLFCETDSPYLHPLKEKNNEPINVIEGYKKISEIKGLKLEEVSIKVWENWKKIRRRSRAEEY